MSAPCDRPDCWFRLIEADVVVGKLGDVRHDARIVPDEVGIGLFESRKCQKSCVHPLQSAGHHLANLFPPTSREEAVQLPEQPHNSQSLHLIYDPDPIPTEKSSKLTQNLGTRIK